MTDSGGKKEKGRSGNVLGMKPAKPQPYRVRQGAETAANVLAAIGVAFALVGFVDLAIMWTPVRFGTPGWEFATVTQTLTNVPLTTFGLGLIAYGLLSHPSRHPLWTRGSAVVFGVLAVVLVGMGLLYVLSVPAVVQAASPEMAGALKRAVLKSGTEMVVYPLTFGLVSVLLWRAVRRSSTMVAQASG